LVPFVDILRDTPMRRNFRRRRRNRGGSPIYIIVVIAALASVWYYISFHAQPYVSGAFVHFIDVGQGDATLIRTGEGNVLIDGGDRHAGPTVVRYLRRARVRSIEYVVATHPHADHIGGLIDVLNEFEIGTIIMPRVAHTTITFEDFIGAIEENNIPVMEPVVGSTINVGGVVFTIVAPNSSGYDNLNDYSVSMLVSYGDIRFLFTGDAESVSEAEMLARGHNLSAHVLHVGHHGSRTSTTQPFFDAVSPLVAVISVGADNPFGHPHREVMNRLEAAEITILRTDHHGTIVISTDGRTLTIR